MNFVTLFPESRDIELVKDVGMIPYTMYKEFGYDSKIACYKNGEYPYLNNEVKGLKIDFLKKYTGKSIIDGIIYLIKNSKKIDNLHLFHFGKRSELWIIIYKKLNKCGKVYLKLDESRDIKKIELKSKSLKNLLRIYALRKCDLISIESKELYEYLNSNWPVDVKFIPNGFTDYGEMKPLVKDEKENYIITVGRIGSKEKANEILLEAFSKIHDKIPDWKVKFIGPIEEKFRSYINEYFNKYPILREKVIFSGAIYDKQKLDYEYRKAKIFCFTSLHESFGIVLVEAIKNGCYIISSDVPAAYDITCYEKYGDIFPVGDIDKLSALLYKRCNNNGEEISKLFNQIQEFAYENYEWKKVCERINNFLL